MTWSFFKDQAAPGAQGCSGKLCRLALAVLPFLFGSQTATACSLALVLAMDSSASVNPQEHQLQLNGLANALGDPDVVQAIEAVGGIYVTSFEWSGRFQQVEQLGWQRVVDGHSARAAARTLRSADRGYTESRRRLAMRLDMQPS